MIYYLSGFSLLHGSELLKTSSNGFSFTDVKWLNWATARRPEISFWGKENGAHLLFFLVTYCLSAYCVLSTRDTASHLFFTPGEEVILRYRRRENK